MTTVANRLRAAVDQSIASHGQHIWAVFPDRTSPPETMVFAYTIGNHQRKLPELLVIGNLQPEQQAFLLNTVAGVMRKRERAFHNGEFVSIGGELPLKVVEASVRVHAEYTVQAGQYWRTEDYRVQQVLIPDKDGKFPGDPGCADPWGSIPVV